MERIGDMPVLLLFALRYESSNRIDRAGKTFACRSRKFQTQSDKGITSMRGASALFTKIVDEVRPLQAALSSAATFTVGAIIPIFAAILPSQTWVVPVVCGASLVCLAALGAIAGRTAGASAWIGAARVAFWGVLAMAATAGVGALFGTKVA
jgi:VIT1/CCC1 family predicted Fe2+/Mn2+ transporter